MGRFILSLALAYMVATGMGMSKARAVEPGTPSCNEKDIVHEYLAEKFQEVPSSAGITSTGRLVEVLSNKSGSWTIIITSTHGLSCLIAAGEGWREVEQVSTDPEA